MPFRAHDFKSCASSQLRHPGSFGVSRIPTEKAAIGIEPMYKGFADPRLTTWLRRPGVTAVGLTTERRGIYGDPCL